MPGKKEKHPLILLALALLFIGLGCLFAIGVKLILRSAGVLETVPGRFVQTASLVTLVMVFYRFYRNRFEERRHNPWPRKVMLRGLGNGLSAGAAMVAVQVGAIALAGSYDVTSFTPSGEVVKYLLLMVLVAFIEELVTRDVIFRLSEKWIGSIAALAVVTVEGALTHATNPNSSFLSSAAVGLEFGLMMSLVYMATRNLWTVTALHFAWNFTMGGIFDISVSGTEAESLLQASYSGQDLITGGAFGTEAGLPAILVCAVVSVCLAVKLCRENGFRKSDHSTSISSTR